MTDFFDLKLEAIFNLKYQLDRPQIDLTMEINAKEFSNKEITVTYDPSLCSLSGRCIKELSEVFMNSVIPWVDINGASPDSIQKQVNRCPSGALKFHLNRKLEHSEL